MTDPDRYPVTDNEDDKRGAAASSATPRWVFGLGILIAVGLITLIIVLHLTGTLGPGAH